MMMSSNTVGNHNFNTAGITPLDTKKCRLKKEEKTTLKLTNAQPDSFERTQPRDTTPEVTTKPLETAPPAGGNGGLVGTILGVVGTTVALTTAIFVGMKHGETQEALKLAQTTAETAQKEATDLKAKLSEQLSKTDVEALIKTSVDEAKNQGTKAIETINSQIDTLTQISQGKADQTTVEELATRVTKIEHPSLQKAHEILETNEEIWNAPLNETLETINKIVSNNTTVTTRTFSTEIQPLFEKITELTIPPKYQILRDKQLRREDNVTCLTLIHSAFNEINPELPADIQRLAHILPNSSATQENYTKQLKDLQRTSASIRDFYEGTLSKEEFTQNLEEYLSPKTTEDIINRTLAVVTTAEKEGVTPDEVKTANKALIGLLQETFGKTKTEQFEAQYPKAVKEITEIAGQSEKSSWVAPLFTGEGKTFSSMSEALLGTGFNTANGSIENTETIRDAKTLATIILPNLIEKIGQTYPDNIRVTRNQGSIFLKNEEGVGEPLRNLVSTLDEFRQALRPINPEKQHYDEIFYTRTPDEINALETVEEQLQAKMINARLQGDTAEMGDITTKMYAHLRAKLQALKEEPLAIVPNVTNTVLAGLPEGESVRLAILNKMDIPVPPFFGVSVFDGFDNTIKGVVNSAFTNEQEQQLVNDALMALFKAKNGDNLTTLEAIQQLKNHQEVAEAFQNAIRNLLNHSERPSDELAQTETNKVIQVIKNGLPSSTIAE